ncbi:MAG: EF-hand domain-containing protein [Pseudoalteromonas spongiae]|jgi:Ca2+-binding EF-hand superfamily protein|uniref:EF-hand domain-containing protein n=1 Tax=Pseudoalteromonas spongiae TaxID=298657 RepID=A0ABU8EVI0_9GAMM|nr:MULTISPECIES: EF-hand domain-containing protein [Pseudoalteromonas]KPV96969.1 EF hand [Pseudoalteromonas sp. P1-9]MEC8328575.1 EF-hand domain-containing protein [Pseudomonadota bacterium]TMO82844.1 calmodulin [Pseudoalteromonas spongiae]
MKKALVIAISMYVMLFATVKAVADEEFALFDSDNSGTISVDEAKRNHALLEQFTHLDRDNNGELSPQEFARFTG